MSNPSQNGIHAVSFRSIQGLLVSEVRSRSSPSAVPLADSVSRQMVEGSRAIVPDDEPQAIAAIAWTDVVRLGSPAISAQNLRPESRRRFRRQVSRRPDFGRTTQTFTSRSQRFFSVIPIPAPSMRTNDVSRSGLVVIASI